MHSAAHKRKAGGTGGGGMATPLLVLGAFLLIIIAGGYYVGGRLSTRRTAPISADAHFRENALRREVTTCQRTVSDLQHGAAGLTAGADGIKGDVAALQAKSAELFKRHEQYEQEAAECAQKAELDRKDFDADAAALAAEINSERAALDGLRAELDAMTNGRGTRLAVDVQALKSMRRLHEALRASLQHDAPAGPDTLPTIEAELLTKWGTHLDNEALFSEGGRRYELATYVKGWQRWEYNSSIHTAIAPITRRIDGNVERAAWNGDFMETIRGMDDPTRPNALPAATVAETVIGMFDAALCAYRRNESTSPRDRISYPTAFQWSPDLGIRASLAGLVDTPLLSLCHGCDSPYNSSTAFALACGGSHGAMRRYGSYPFWAMRSRLRFSEDVYNEADAFMERHALEEGAFTAVVNHVSESARQKCGRSERINYGPHRLWLEHNFGIDAVRHVSEDRDEQCMPSEGDLKAVLAKGGSLLPMVVPMGPERRRRGDNGDDAPARRSFLGRAMGFGDGGDADDLRNPNAQMRVYLSAPDMATERVESADVRIVSREIDTPFDEAVDIVVASRARNIIVSPFFTHSQAVTELFLLNNELDPRGVTFF